MAANFSAPKTATTQKRKSGFPSAPLRHAGTVADIVESHRPEIPLYIIRPDDLAAKAREFLDIFPGEALYAVKCNPEKTVLQTLHKAGVRSFDVASIEEARLVARAAPKAKMYFMHPVKSPEAIREAYYKHGVRAFVLDTQEELYKILRETDLAPDLELFVRLALPKNGKAAIDFSSKFGAAPEEAARLLKLSRAVAARLGLCFHVGTQTMDPGAYERGIAAAASVIAASGIAIDVLDIGGGFPVAYPDQIPPSLGTYMKAIAQGLRRYKLDKIPLLAEPGRALVAAAGSLVVRVEQRRGDLLYINDGTYGGLFDAGAPLNTRFPVRRVDMSGSQERSARLIPFRFAGPTCDSLDMMPGPFMLPDDIKTGDYIEIGNMGAYSASMRSNFNGFGRSALVALYDQLPQKTTSEVRKKSQ